MDPFTLSRLSLIRQQEILDQAKPTWTGEPSAPSLTTQMIRQIALMLGELLIITGVRLRNLYAENVTAPAPEQPCESPC
jgi:hypothetical protein